MRISVRDLHLENQFELSTFMIPKPFDKSVQINKDVSTSSNKMHLLYEIHFIFGHTLYIILKITMTYQCLPDFCSPFPSIGAGSA